MADTFSRVARTASSYESLARSPAQDAMQTVDPLTGAPRLHEAKLPLNQRTKTLCLMVISSAHLEGLRPFLEFDLRELARAGAVSASAALQHIFWRFMATGEAWPNIDCCTVSQRRSEGELRSQLLPRMNASDPARQASQLAQSGLHGGIHLNRLRRKLWTYTASRI